MKAEDCEITWMDRIDGERANTLVLPEEYADLKKKSHDSLELATIVSMLNHAKEMGDIPDRLRRIRHVSYFKSEKASDRFAKKLASNGYIDVNVMKFLGVPLWRIDFFRIGNATLPHMAHMNCIVKKMVEKAGGEYDGVVLPTMSTDVPDESLHPENDGPIWSIVTMAPRDQSVNHDESNATQLLVA
ncbi:ribonuclease E inhibitor RraB [Paraburkholderia aromaticivorans]|uniref:ribonuclease E inhibitor RraB n=1 Tax=Paraburkholderia aromaticivorans TaxID=2026199 RepID=UPI00145601E9|nr:ribonuclease E inhibitor RraB [Paraburkholderia aromaticivorans]